MAAKWRIFLFFKMAAAAIVDFRNFKFLTVRRVKKSSCIIVPNFVAIAQTAAEIRQLFDFSKMAAVLHFRFVMRMRDNPRRTFDGLYHCANLVEIDAVVLIICTFIVSMSLA